MGRRTGDTPAHVPLLSGTWDEGRLWDHWMVVHFLSGTTAGLSNVVLTLSSVSLWLLAIGLMVAWEITEFVAGVDEEIENRVVDLGVGILGVFVSTTLASGLAPRDHLRALAASALLLGVGCFLGWRAYRRRTRR